jgi:hypothetical protein
LQTDAIDLTTLVLVLLPWIAFGVAWLLEKKSPNVEETKRAPGARFGILLQSISFALVWLVPRPL